MKEIKMLVEYIFEEIEDAEKYAKSAMKKKDYDKELSQVFAELARQELGHADTLHNQALRIIKEYKANRKETPPEMQAVWDWEHEKIVEKTICVRQMLEMYKQ